MDPKHFSTSHFLAQNVNIKILLVDTFVAVYRNRTTGPNCTTAYYYSHKTATSFNSFPLVKGNFVKAATKRKKKAIDTLDKKKSALKKHGCEKSCFQQSCSASAIYPLLCLPLSRSRCPKNLLMYSDSMFLFKMLASSGTKKNRKGEKKPHLDFSKALMKGFSLIVREGILKGVIKKKKVGCTSQSDSQKNRVCRTQKGKDIVVLVHPAALNKHRSHFPCKCSERQLFLQINSLWAMV